jgi:hypothetical protein
MIRFEVTPELQAQVNDPATLAALPDQIAQRDPACIPVLAAMAVIAGEGLQLSFEALGSLLPHMPPELAKEIKKTLCQSPELAALVMKGEAGL